MQKLVLENEWTPTFEVYGISTHVRDYRLCWSLNRSLALSFSRDVSETTHFKCKVAEKDICFELVKNRTEEGFLMAEVRQADFLFFVLYGEDAQVDDHFQKIQNTQFVNAVFTLNTDLKERALALIDPDGY